MHGSSHQHTFARPLQTAKNVHKCDFIFSSLGCMSTNPVYVSFGPLCPPPHHTQQLDQNQPEKLLEDQKRVCPDKWQGTFTHSSQTLLIWNVTLQTYNFGAYCVCFVTSSLVFLTPKPPVSANNCFSKKGHFFSNITNIFPWASLSQRYLWQSRDGVCPKRQALII